MARKSLKGYAVMLCSTILIAIFIAGCSEQGNRVVTVTPAEQPSAPAAPEVAAPVKIGQTPPARNSTVQNATAPAPKVTVQAKVLTNTSNGYLDSDNDGIPDFAEKTLGTNPYNADTDGDGINDKADSHPVLVDNPPSPSTGSAGLRIQKAFVEDNYDSITQKSTPDHLEMILENTIDQDISNITVYYVISDAHTSQKESYLVKLKGFVIKAHSSETIDFDNEPNPFSLGTNHFGENPNSIYHTTMDELVFNITVNAEGYEAQNALATRVAGGLEAAD